LNPPLRAGNLRAMSFFSALAALWLAMCAMPASAH
jgi:hypothetical protein